MNPVAVIGGGITGLVAAHRLARQGIAVTLYESASRVGGVIRTVEKDGFLAEGGPNTILETSPVIGSLVAELGLEAERVYADPAAKNRYILRRGIPVRVPDSLFGFLQCGLFSGRAKLRIPAELFIRRAGEGREESVASFVRRRLGKEFLDYAINPMVAGIYAGDPERLSVKHGFPKLYETEQRYGSLLLGQVLGARSRSRQKEVSKRSAPKFSFRHGLQTLTDALSTRLGGSVVLRSAVRAIRRTHAGWEVLTEEEPSPRRHSAVLLSAPAHALAKIGLEAVAPLRARPLSFLSGIPYAPVSSLVMGFRREDVAHPLDGFGFLIPEVEGRAILGAIFSSSLFANRAPAGHVTITCYLGGLRSPGLAMANTGVAVAAALGDLRGILGIQGEPVFVHRTCFPKAIAQYEIGFGRYKEFFNELEVALPGLHFAGHFRDGVSLGDSILSGEKAAAAIGASLATERPRPSTPTAA